MFSVHFELTKSWPQKCKDDDGQSDEEQNGGVSGQNEETTDNEADDKGQDAVTKNTNTLEERTAWRTNITKNQTFA